MLNFNIIWYLRPFFVEVLLGAESHEGAAVEGKGVGVNEGYPDGTKVLGVPVGTAVGYGVGIRVGRRVGWGDGGAEGLELGADDGL